MESKPTVLDLLFKVRASHSLSESTAHCHPDASPSQTALGTTTWVSALPGGFLCRGLGQLQTSPYPASPPCCHHAGKSKRYLEEDEGQKEVVQKENKGSCDCQRGEAGLQG